MSTTATAILPDTEVLPAAPARRSILHPDPSLAQPGPTPFDGWRGQARTEETAAVPAPRRRRSAARLHLRCALVGTLLAIVAITGLSSYAAQGIADARSAALRQAHISCK